MVFKKNITHNTDNVAKPLKINGIYLMSMKPFADACERNREPILEVIQPLLSGLNTLLEIGSGTGQHAVYFSEKLPQLCWQTSDLVENHVGIELWRAESGLNNILPPIALDVLSDPWPNQLFDAIYSANTAHIMPWRAVEKMFIEGSKKLVKNGLFILYGPFNYNGDFTSDSNKQFEVWLKSVSPERGIRDFEALRDLAQTNALSFIKDYPMPANNRILVWQKK